MTLSSFRGCSNWPVVFERVSAPRLTGVRETVERRGQRCLIRGETSQLRTKGGHLEDFNLVMWASKWLSTDTSWSLSYYKMLKKRLEG